MDTTILQSTVLGGRKPGRQKLRWEVNVKEWTGLTQKSMYSPDRKIMI